MTNKITDLNGVLFDQLNRLNVDDLGGEKLEAERKRTEAIVVVARELIAAGQLALQAEKARGDLIGLNPMPHFLDVTKRLK